MKFPDLDTPFISTPDAASHDVFHSFSKGMCPTCRALVDGVRIIRDGKVYLRKQCPRHGTSEALISGDADWFLRSLTYIKEGSVPLKQERDLSLPGPHGQVPCRLYLPDGMEQPPHLSQRHSALVTKCRRQAIAIGGG